MHDGMYGFGMGWMGWVSWIFFVLIITIIVWAILRAGGKSQTTPDNSRETPLQTLERRYANGEISTEEFRERKKELLGM